MLLKSLKTVRLIYAALASSRWPQQRLHRLQEDRLRKLLIHAYNNVPLYRRLYDEAGFRPEDFGSLDDLEKIPLLRKERLKNASPEEILAHGVDPGRCQSVKTSGSTGVPLRIYLGSNEQLWQRAVAWRILFEHGFHWTDRTMEIRMTPGDSFFVQRIGIAPKDWVSILAPPQSWARHLAQKGPKVIVASATTLQALVEAIEELGLQTWMSRPRIIISDSETLSPATRLSIRRVTGVDPVDVYGLVELSNFAWQCEYKRGYHVSSDSHVVEVAAAPGESGPIIATDLGMWTMPIIRYDTGDFAEIDAKPCPCGRRLPVLGRIYGRAVDSVVLPNGRRLFWPFFHEVLGDYKELRQWKVIQHDLQQLRVQLALPHRDISTVENIKDNLLCALPKEIELKIELVDNIPLTPGEKARMVVSHVNAGAKNESKVEQ